VSLLLHVGEVVHVRFTSHVQGLGSARSVPCARFSIQVVPRCVVRVTEDCIAEGQPEARVHARESSGQGRMKRGHDWWCPRCCSIVAPCLDGM
jgi:hypothetical protein